MTTQTTITPTAFVGWHRPSPRSPWRAIVQADTEDAAFRQRVLWQQLFGPSKNNDKT